MAPTPIIRLLDFSVKAQVSVTLMRCCLIFPSDKTRFWYHEKGEDKLWFEVGTAVVGFKAFSKSSQTGM